MKKIDIYKDRFEKMISTAKATRFWKTDWVFSDGKKRWKDLLNYWEELDDAELMIDAMHLLHWGFLPQGRYNEKEMKLVEQITYELQSKGEASEAWFEDEMVNDIFLNIIETMDSYGSVYQSSTEHHEAMANNTVWEVMLEHPEYPDAIKEALLYKEFVYKVVPEAATWTKAQWMDDQNIFAAMKATYGIDCTVVNPNDDPVWTYAGLRYDRIVLFYKMLKVGMGNGSAYALLRMPVFTKELLKDLCGGNVEGFLTEAYLKVYEWAQQDEITISRCETLKITCTDIKNSFFHRFMLCCSFVTDNQQLKDAIFDVEMCG